MTTARLKPYLQLVRLPNVFTAGADSLAGWLLVVGAFDRPARWVPLVVASMCIYAAGIALNDVFDLELDRVERPGRPLPSGGVTSRFALGLAVILLVLALVLAGLSSPRSLAVAVLLVVCVVAYDSGLRRTPAGPVVMGACRGLNVLLGMSQAADLGGPWGWVVAGALGVFVAGLTWISRSETVAGQNRGVIAGMAVQQVALLGLLAAACHARDFPGASSRPIVPVEGLLVLVVVALVVDLAAGRAVRLPRPETIQHAVKTGVFSLVWLNVGVVAAVRGPLPALAVAALWVPAFALGRWLYST